MARLDYNAAMLELYFKEMGFSKLEQKQLLERNPFDGKFVEWERNKAYDNRTFSVLLRKHHYLDYDSKIIEVLVHKDNSAAKCFQDIFYSICGANDKLSVDLRSGRIVLIKGMYNGEEELLRKYKYYKVPFVIGDTSSGKYYEEEREFFKSIGSSLGLEQVEEKNYKNNTILLKSK